MPVELDNDPRNPCIGCGPEHPFGLRLRFFRDGDAVRSTLATSDAHVGFPGTVHTAVLYMALVEVANWTVWGLLGRASVPRSTGALETHARVPARAVVELEGRLVQRRPEGVRTRSEARVDGALVAAIEREHALPTRAEFAKALPLAAGHPALADAFPEA